MSCELRKKNKDYMNLAWMMMEIFPIGASVSFLKYFYRRHCIYGNLVGEMASVDKTAIMNGQKMVLFF